jgi:hypothetical protein
MAARQPGWSRTVDAICAGGESGLLRCRTSALGGCLEGVAPDTHGSPIGQWSSG